MTTTVQRLDAWRAKLAAVAERLDRPTTSYYLVLGVTLMLLFLGLLMVFSASAVDSLKQAGTTGTFTLGNEASAFAYGQTQALYAVVGLIVLAVASRLPVTLWKRLALLVLLAGLLIQALILFSGLGQYSNGNVNWLRIGPVRLQGSEVIKIGLALAGGLLLAPRRRRLGRVKDILLPFGLFAAAGMGLVLRGGDMGTVIVIVGIVAACLFTAGVPMRFFVILGGLGAALATLLVVWAPHRLSRFDVWLGKDTDPFGNARQPLHAKYALADGGWFGLGIGASREKWLWLPEPHNDFIFAIIGEELGIVGTFAVILLFVLLVLACYRIVLKTDDLFVKIATAGIASWIALQAIINIGSVTGMMPIIGVPLPLVSSGGSSLITTLFGLGILLSFARSEKGARASFASHRLWWAHLMPRPLAQRLLDRGSR